jgi:hypothetical protein
VGPAPEASAPDPRTTRDGPAATPRPRHHADHRDVARRSADLRSALAALQPTVAAG